MPRCPAVWSVLAYVTTTSGDGTVTDKGFHAVEQEAAVRPGRARGQRGHVGAGLSDWSGSSVRIRVLTGGPGVGKTGLALHWANRVRATFHTSAWLALLAVAEYLNHVVLVKSPAPTSRLGTNGVSPATAGAAEGQGEGREGRAAVGADRRHPVIAAGDLVAARRTQAAVGQFGHRDLTRAQLTVHKGV